MNPIKNDEEIRITYVFSGLVLLLSLFFLNSGFRTIMAKMAEPVPGVHNFVVGHIQGEVNAPTVRAIHVDIDPETLYFIQAEVSGEPEIHIDLMSPASDYDNPAQELVIPAWSKIGTYSLLINSDKAPSSNVFFRVFFKDVRPISIKNINLMRLPIWIYRINIILIWFIGIAGLSLIIYGVASRHIRIGVIVFLLSAFASYHFTGYPLVGDNQNYGMVARSLLSDSDIILNEFSGRIESQKFYGTVQDKGDIYNLFPLGPSIMLAPLYALVSVDPNIDPYAAEIRAGKLATALFFGVSIALFFFLASRFDNVNQKAALLLAFIFGFCSHQLSQHLTMFWSHNAEMPFVLAALLALKTERRNMVFGAGLLLGLGYVMRPTAALLVPIVMVWLWIYRRDFIKHFVAGCFIGGVLVVSMNLAFYGHLVSPYSQIDRLGYASFFEALMGNLISPNRGLFVFMPWTVFSMWGIWLSFRSKDASFFRLLSVIFFFHLTLVSSFPHWWAGESYGPRFLVETMPMLVLLLLPVFSSRLWNHKVVKRVFVATVVFSFLVQIGGLTTAANQWNQLPINVDQHPSRLWEWDDMQILRPLSGGGESAKH